MNRQQHSSASYRIIFREDKQPLISNIVLQGELQRDATDELIVLIEQCIERAENPFIFINVDISNPAIKYTPYSRQRSEDVLAFVPQNKMLYLAICVNEGQMYHIVRLLVRQDKNRYQNVFQRVFTNRADAGAWLCEKAKQCKPQKRHDGLEEAHDESESAAD